jgi:hypothetical protein
MMFVYDSNIIVPDTFLKRNRELTKTGLKGGKGGKSCCSKQIYLLMCSIEKVLTITLQETRGKI